MQVEDRHLIGRRMEDMVLDRRQCFLRGAMMNGCLHGSVNQISSVIRCRYLIREFCMVGIQGSFLVFCSIYNFLQAVFFNMTDKRPKLPRYG